MQRLSYYAILILVFSIPAINFDLPGPLGPVNRLLGVAAISIWLAKVVFTHQIRRPRIIHLMILLFVLLNLASFFWSLEPADSLDRTLRLMQSCVLVLMVWDVCRTRAQVETAHLLYVVGCYIAVLATVINFLQGVRLGGEDRFAAAGFDPNDMGLILCMGIPWAWQFAISKRAGRPIFQIIGYAYPAAAILAILLAGSRGALIAAIPGLFYVVITMRRAHPAARVALPILIVAAVAILSMQRGGPLQRFTKLENSASADNLTGRVDIWKAGLQIFQKHPLLGVGGGAFPTAVEPFHIKQAQVYGYKIVAHNTYLSVLTELGVIGFVVFLALLASLLREIIHQPPADRAASLFTFAVWAVGVFSLTFEYRSQTWLVFGLLLLSGHALPEDLSVTSDDK